jgi:hypothetical protein
MNRKSESRTPIAAACPLGHELQRAGPTAADHDCEDERGEYAGHGGVPDR